ncbi:ATP-binding protein [Ruicaihuangia caeni]|uniref:ATP-binding protein n=1 Tax=Ruicaihuangia caeni TaxID=3042517 RepID=A0AAW6T6M9_9MICO|nr:ATP-binding protein [Klugiella sp. YN-L-19]MDI2098321.1 ATP-binding protein [Klugiella sp. YN-L-19]
MDINIRPEVNILGVLRHLNYKPWFALAEFVDNSIASALQHRLASPGRPLRVTIDLYPEDGGRVVIRDNAGGIDPADFPRAFRAAQAPPDRTGLSEFGMGMKSAATWFAREWKVTTSVAGDAVERTVHFDIDEIRDNQRDTIHVREAPTEANSHFTTIELFRLNHIPQTKTLSKIKAHLSSIYREFLRTGNLELVFRGEKLTFAEVEPLVAPRASDPRGAVMRWVKKIDFSLDETHRVYGFAGLRAKGSTAEAGFALMRRGRLILGSADETYRPVEIFGRSTTHTYQRLYGELTLEGFEVSHTKDGFRWDGYEDAFLEALEAALSDGDLDLLKQASNYRLQPIADHRKPVEEAVTKVATSVEEHFDTVASRVIAQRSDDEEHIPDTVTQSRDFASINRSAQVVLEGEVWTVDLEATLEDGIPDWIAVGAEVPGAHSASRLPETRVKVTVSLAHPFSRKFLGAANENSEMIMAFAATIGLALALGKRSGAKSHSVIRRINELARETFSSIDGTEDKG